MNNDRREFFKVLGLAGIGLASTGVVPVYGSGKLSCPPVEEYPTLTPYNRFPRMLHEYFVGQVRGAEKKIIMQLVLI